MLYFFICGIVGFCGGVYVIDVLLVLLEWLDVVMVSDGSLL